MTNQVRFLASCTLQEGDGLVTRPIARQRPGVLSSFHGLNSPVVLAPGSDTAAAGDRVQVQLFPAIFAETPLSPGNPETQSGF
ncbi:MAG: hypothetical protein KGZ57_12035 [Dethiobacter sp.]|nr:hypothetical protein [Dethiobacter sp.]